MDKFSEEVYRLIEKIVTRTERINSYEGRIPAIELDLALEDIRRLYDCFLVAGPIASMPVAPVASTELAGEAENPDVHTVAEISHQEPAGQEVSVPAEEGAADAVSGEQVQAVPLKTDPVTEVTPAPEKVQKGRADRREEETEKPEAKQILAEKLTRGDMRSVNDLIAARKTDVSISARLQHNPISSLKSAIGINEKFIFVYELFGGNSQEYARTIDQLNSMPGRGEAIELMEALRREYHWDLENMAFQKLVDMVSRRYS
ncbi:MAG: hypothetical protein R6V49_05490 [Bacteroidales bacterium]